MNNIYEVYKLTFPNNKVYIGLTRVGTKNRFLRHIYDSKRKKFKISNAIRKYKNQIQVEVLHKDLFQFEAMELEKFYINKYSSMDISHGYNMSEGGDARPPGCKGKPKAQIKLVNISTAEILEFESLSLASESLKICMSGLSQLKSGKLRSFRGFQIYDELYPNGINPNHKASWKEKLRQVNLGKSLSDEVKEKIRFKNAGENHYSKSGRHTDQHLLEMKEKRCQAKRKKVKCIETGQIFNSCVEAEKTLGLPRSKIGSVLSGKRAHTGGYTFVKVENE